MKTIKIFMTLVMVTVLFACKKKSGTDLNYVFVKPYCAKITVGGVIGVKQKCFKIGDIVTGKQADNSFITIRIAEHTTSNDGPPSPNSYLEFLNVPIDNLKLN